MTQAFIKTLAGKTLLLAVILPGNLHFVDVNVSSLFPQPLTIDVPCDSITKFDLAFECFLGSIQEHAVDSFVGQLIGKAALPLGKESTQSKTQPFILFASAFQIGM